MLWKPFTKRCRLQARRPKNARPLKLAGGERLEGRQLLAVDLVTPIPAQSLGMTGSSLQVDLAGSFRLGDSLGSVVRVDTNANLARPRFYVELFDRLGGSQPRTTPVTANNFLAYVADGSYANSIVHRSVAGLFQGGGYKAPAGPADLSDGRKNPAGYPTAIAPKAAIADEIGNPHLRGTIAMAKSLDSSSRPIAGSARSQWFVNVADNRDFDPAYAVFGRVLGNGMSVVDTLASVPASDASGYYSEPAFKTLPLWDFPLDQNIQPQNFLTITSASQVTATELVEFSVTSLQPGVVRAEISGRSVVVSRAGTGGGTATVRVRAASAFNPQDFRDHDFTVVVSPALDRVIESNGMVALAYDSTGDLWANSARITMNGLPVNYHTTSASGWTAVAADVVGGTNTVVLRHAGGAIYSWRLDASWNQISGDSWATPGSTDFFNSELTLDADFNGDGVVGFGLTPIESVGGVSLAFDVAGTLRANGTAVIYNGSPVNYPSIVASGWRPVAAEAVGGTNTVVFRHSSGNLHFWRLDGSWTQVSSDGWLAINNPEFFTAETIFGTDFNGDGAIGSLSVTIESVGSVILTYGSAGNLRANGKRISYNGTSCNYHTMVASGWTVVAADVVGGINTVVLKHSSGNLHFWRMSTTWGHVSSDGWLGTTNPDYFTTETTFGLDFNGDNAIGSLSITIESAGSVILTYGSAGNLRANGKRIFFNGSSLNYLTTAAGGWTVMAADVVGGVNTLVLKHSSGFLHFWRMNASWAQVSGDGWLAPGSAEALATESTFGVDINGNGTIGT